MSTLFMLLWYFTSMALQIVTFTWQVLAHERGVHAQTERAYSGTANCFIQGTLHVAPPLTPDSK
jgi:hypothetical protein